jgi:thiol-disulfide isomerase/thioredoxin
MMKRRDFLAVTTAATLLPATLRAAPIPYVPGLVDERLAAGETVFLDFYADWCSTCRSQSRTMDSLKAANPAYEAAITFIQVDWDTYQDDALTTSLGIPRRSTLVVLKGDQELGRIVAGTREAEIKALMDTALAATS